MQATAVVLNLVLEYSYIYVTAVVVPVVLNLVHTVEVTACTAVVDMIRMI